MECRLPRCTPEETGVSSAVLAELIRELDGCEQVHSLMIVRHGKVICETAWAPYRLTEPHQMFSLSKSFTSTAVGMCVDEGRLSIDDPVSRYFRDVMPETLTPELEAMTVRNLLTMSSGHGECIAWKVVADGTYDWPRAFFQNPLKEAPGKHFLYNSMATYMLSVLVTRLTGQTVREYLRTRLFDPLGIPCPEWDTCPQGYSTGGWGLHLCTEDIAKFGQLYLQRGCWEGRRLLSDAWIAQATTRQIATPPQNRGDWLEGYGFQFWMCSPKGVYRGDGAYGQFCVVLPEQDTVIAMTEAASDLQKPLDVLWRLFIPACSGQSLPSDPQALDALWETAANRSVRIPDGVPAPDGAECAMSVQFEENDRGMESATLSFDADGCLWTVTARGGIKREFPFGRGGWRYGRECWDFEHDGAHSAGRMVWLPSGDLMLCSCELGGPFRFDIRLSFRKPGVIDTVTVRKNFHFWGSKAWGEWKAKA